MGNPKRKDNSQYCSPKSKKKPGDKKTATMQEGGILQATYKKLVGTLKERRR
jgi:hypothetical protein